MLQHMAIAGLIHADLVHLVVSQNVDALHLRSGVPRKNLSELHGNIFLEKCRKCDKVALLLWLHVPFFFLPARARFSP